MILEHILCSKEGTKDLQLPYLSFRPKGEIYELYYANIALLLRITLLAYDSVPRSLKPNTAFEMTNERLDANLNFVASLGYKLIILRKHYVIGDI
jgi:hypothetical protein